MSDEPDPALAEEQPAVAATPEITKAERFTAIIRNGLSNSALSRDATAWASLETLLPEVVAAILQEA